MDYSESNQAADRMEKAAQKLRDMAPMVGMARQIKEYDSDRRKNLLASYTVKHLKNGESAVASEAFARADDNYNLQLDEMGKQLASAEKTIAQWNAEQASFEAARSLLSFSKATMEIL